MTDILKTVDDACLFRQANNGKTTALVPTMGNLHDGHISLMRIAQQNADTTIASIFVNPTQFAPNEDLDAYPRTFEADVDKLRSIGADAVFYPDVETIYPHGDDETIAIHMPDEMTKILCGLGRPTHFQGVATVVAKLLQIVKPTVAVFGNKDFQQLAIIRRLVEELFIDTDIIGGDIIREDSGLAMSSRNQYLSDDERQQAAWLSKTLLHARQQLLAGKSTDAILAEAKQILFDQDIAVEYLDFRHRQTLAENPSIEQGILLIAAKVGTTRLIDNLSIT